MSSWSLNISNGVSTSTMYGIIHEYVNREHPGGYMWASFPYMNELMKVFTSDKCHIASLKTIISIILSQHSNNVSTSSLLSQLHIASNPSSLKQCIITPLTSAQHIIHAYLISTYYHIFEYEKLGYKEYWTGKGTRSPVRSSLSTLPVFPVCCFADLMTW